MRSPGSGLTVSAEDPLLQTEAILEPDKMDSATPTRVLVDAMLKLIEPRMDADGIHPPDDIRLETGPLRPKLRKLRLCVQTLSSQLQHLGVEPVELSVKVAMEEAGRKTTRISSSSEVEPEILKGC